MEKLHSIINEEYGYYISHFDDGTCTIKVYSAACDDKIEIDGINGYLMVSDMASDSEDLNDLDKLTETEYYEEAMELLNEWQVDEDTAMSICDRLTPWFKRFAISEADKAKQNIKALEEMIAYRRYNIEGRMSDIRSLTEEIEKRTMTIELHLDRIAELNEEIDKYTKTIEALKASLTMPPLPDYEGNSRYVW